MSTYVVIDERGEIYINDLESKVSDPQKSQQILKNLKLSPDYTLTTELDGEPYLVEAFDFPLIGYAVNFFLGQILIHTDYNLYFEADPQAWAVDEADQFYGVTTAGVPFKLSKKAHAQLFSLCSEYDDESFTIDKHRFLTPFYYQKNKEINSPKFWNEIYQTEKPGWDLGQPAEAFKDMLPRLKLPKSRILVLGCGYGHDAALFADVGHVVTAIDFSAEAISEARKKYGHISNLTFEQRDVFDLPHEWNFTFDLIIEHTLFCAIEPSKREKLITVWKRLLHEEGQLLAIFFSMFKRLGPPYGSTESEIRHLLAPFFQFLFWGRLRNSIPRRLGKELFVLAKKR